MPRSTRQIPVADHLWDVYGRMAEEMGSDREALVNEAMHAFARLHGYVVPGIAAPGPADPGAGATRERRAVTERVLETAARLEREIAAPQPGTAVAGVPPPAEAASRPGALWLRRDDGAVIEVGRDRFVLGRGSHCDLVVDSPKISREHAAFVRTADGWWIEDLGSSNGTWLHGERVTRRRVENGDEYFLCAEKIRCALR